MKIQMLEPPSDEVYPLIDFLTEKINVESPMQANAYPFAFCIKDEKDNIVAGCNGSVVFGVIYTDQLWVHPEYRHQGLGRKVMEHVHQYGQSRDCRMATVTTMDFQNARTFYEKLGYVCDFERAGYANGAIAIFLRKLLGDFS